MLSSVYDFPPQVRGFTMVELMVVVAILAILATLAGPSLVPVLDRWRVRQAVEEMRATYSFARSEAIKRGGNVVVVRTTPGSECTLPSTDTLWDCGWTVFDDADRNGTLDTNENLRVTGPMTGVRVTYVGGGPSFELTRWGEPVGGGTLRIRIRSTRTGSTVDTTLCAGGGGRIYTKPGDVAC